MIQRWLSDPSYLWVASFAVATTVFASVVAFTLVMRTLLDQTAARWSDLLDRAVMTVGSLDSALTQTALNIRSLALTSNGHTDAIRDLGGRLTILERRTSWVLPEPETKK